MLWEKLPFVDVIHPQTNKFVTGVKVQVTGESKLNDSPVGSMLTNFRMTFRNTNCMLLKFTNVAIDLERDSKHTMAK